MPLVKNIRTGKIANVPEHYIGHPVLGGDLIEIDKVSSAAPKKEKKKKTGYVPDAIDGDGDGFVQDGTEWQRPVNTEIEEQPAPEIDIETNEE